MSNVFTKAKALRRKHPGKSWQQLVQMASKQRSAPKKKAAKKRKVGATKILQPGESRSTPAKRIIRQKRTKKGLFKGTEVVSMGSIKRTYEEHLKAAMWQHEKATTVKATKAAAAKIRKYRKLLKQL